MKRARLCILSRVHGCLCSWREEAHCGTLAPPSRAVVTRGLWDSRQQLFELTVLVEKGAVDLVMECSADRSRNITRKDPGSHSPALVWSKGHKQGHLGRIWGCPISHDSQCIFEHIGETSRGHSAVGTEFITIAIRENLEKPCLWSCKTFEWEMYFTFPFQISYTQKKLSLSS